MQFIKKAVSRYFKPPVVYDVSELSEKDEVTDEIEKTFWDLQKSLNLSDAEVKSAVKSLKKLQNRNK